MTIESGLTGKVILITGGAGGVGLAIGQRFLEEGSRVVLADVSAEGLAQAQAALAPLALAGASAAAVRTIVTDVTDVADCERLIAATVAWGGRLDALVTAAGRWTEGPSEAVSELAWDRVIDVNLKGTFFCCSRAIPELKKTQGCIVSVSSEAGVTGTPETAAYTASKGGVNSLIKSLAMELAPHLVRVNAVCPGDIMTPMLEGQARDFGGGDREGYFKTLLSSYPQGEKARFIGAAEVAELVVYLCSAAAAPITGALMSIDFGTSAGYTYG